MIGILVLLIYLMFHHIIIQGGEIAAKILIETGCRNLAFIHTCSNVYGEIYKLKVGFIDIYKKNGIN